MSVSKSVIISPPFGARWNICNAIGAATSATPRPTSTHRAKPPVPVGRRSATVANPAMSSPGATKNHGKSWNGGRASTAS
jgi:hypothetical protein